MFSSRYHDYYPSPFSESLAPVQRTVGVGFVTGFVDTTGKFVVVPQYGDVNEFSEGLASVRNVDGCGYIDRTGHKVLSFKFGCGGQFSEGLAVQTAATGRLPMVDPQAEQNWMERGRLLQRQRRYDGALDAFGQAESYHDGKCPECILGEAEALAGQGWYSTALLDCSRFFDANPTDQRLVARGHELEGECLVEAAKQNDSASLKKAEDQLRLAIEMDKNLDLAPYYLGRVLLKENRDAEGVQELRSYVDQNPDGIRVEDAKRFIGSPELGRENYSPDFAITTLQGQQLTRDKLRGKVVLLDFWATWCPPCRQTLPKIAKIAHEFAGDPFVLISISDDTSEQQWRDFIRDHNMDWPQSFEPKGLLDSRFQVGAIPTLVLIDQQGVIRFHGWGWQTGRVESQVRQLLKQ